MLARCQWPEVSGSNTVRATRELSREYTAHGNSSRDVSLALLVTVLSNDKSFTVRVSTSLIQVARLVLFQCNKS